MSATHSAWPTSPSAETETSRNCFVVVRPKEVSKGKRRGRLTRRTSTASILRGYLARAGRRGFDAHFRHRPKMWCRWPSTSNPMPEAISSWRRSIGGL